MSRPAAPELVVLGSGTAVPTLRRSPSAYVVRAADGDVTLVDPGPGAVQRACLAGFPVESIRRVLLTHHHPDHCLDVVALLFALRNPVVAEAWTGRLEIAGGPGTAHLLDRFRHVFGGWIALPEGRCTVRELAPGPFRLGAEVAGEAFPIQHTPASLAYRLTFANGAVLALSGDTEECAGAVDVARDADHYLLEAAFPDSRPGPGHLTPAAAARVATAARCRHLILTHFYPPVDVEEARRVVTAVYPGRVTIAEDGLRVPLLPEEPR